MKRSNHLAGSLIGGILIGGCQSTGVPPSAPGNSSALVEPVGPRIVQPFPGVLVDLDRHLVELEATTCLDAGWLEQVACTPGTREHEALVTVTARPSHIHAGLLLAGFSNGAPGRWGYEDRRYTYTAPTGEALKIEVRYEDAGGQVVTEPISTWIRAEGEALPFPEQPWIFGGSELRPNTTEMGPGEHYVADFSGSVVGLVTFGDEIIGFSEVIADDASIQEPQWMANTQAMPPVGTEVALIVSRNRR